MTTFGGLATPLAVFAAGLLVAYLVALSRRVRGHPDAPAPRARVFARPCCCARGLGRDRAGPAIRLGWVSVGAARLQPGRRCCRSRRSRAWSASTASRACSPCAAAAAAMIVVGRGSRALGRSRRSWPALVARRARSGVRRGWRRVGADAAGAPVRVAVLQGNIAQEEKWNPALADAITDRYLAMTRAGARAGGDVHPLARVVDAVLLRAGHRPRRCDSAARARDRARRCSSAAIRSSRYGRPDRRWRKPP